MKRFLAVPAVALAALVLASGAQAQDGRLQVKSYQAVGKQKLQVDLSIADAGELYRDLRDYLKRALAQRGNPIGTSGDSGVKIVVNYAAPLPSDGGGDTSTGPVPDRRAPAFRQPQVAPPRKNALHVSVTIYREKGGSVLWSGDATCYADFSSSKIVGRAMVDQLVERIDKTYSGSLDCPG